MSQEYYQQNIPTGIPLHQRLRFVEGGGLVKTYTVPVGKTAVISAIKFKPWGIPFRHMIDEAKVVADGKVTINGATGKDHKNLILVDSAYSSADALYAAYNAANPGDQWYYHGQDSMDPEGHDEDGFGTFHPRSGVVNLRNDVGNPPGNGVTVYVDYIYFDWSLTVAVSSIGWSYVMSDLFDYWQNSFADTTTAEAIIIQIMLGDEAEDRDVEGGLFGTMSSRYFVPLATNLVIATGETITFTMDAITDWGDNAIFDMEIFGWLIDNP